MKFIDTLKEKSPVYYPSDNGPRNLKYTIRIKPAKKFIDLLSYDPSLELEGIDWKILYYWKYPHYNYVNRPVWLKSLSYLKNLIGMSFLKMARSAMTLAPVDFSKTEISYRYTPGMKYPHHLHWIYKNFEYNNYSIDYYYDSNYVLRKKIENIYLSKIIKDHYVYKTLRNGQLLLLSVRTHSIPEVINNQLDFKYAKVGRYYILKSLKLTFPQEVDTIHKEIIPMEIVFEDISLNEEAPPSIPFGYLYVW